MPKFYPRQLLPTGAFEWLSGHSWLELYCRDFVLPFCDWEHLKPPCCLLPCPEWDLEGHSATHMPRHRDPRPVGFLSSLVKRNILSRRKQQERRERKGGSISYFSCQCDNIEERVYLFTYLFGCVFFFWDMISLWSLDRCGTLYRPSWPLTHRDPPACASTSWD